MTRDAESLPATFTSESYLSLFPRTSLVYLSPDAKEEMREFDPTAIYIIGGFVDKYKAATGVTFAKAKRQGLRVLRFPVDSYAK